MSYYKPQWEVAEIARSYKQDLLQAKPLISRQKKVLTNIMQCRTPVLGGHLEVCNNNDCKQERFAYNGCRDRHCPKCNGLKKEKWIWQRKADSLPVAYFHVVFTLPDKLNNLCLANQAEMYNLLFRTAWQTVEHFTKDHKHLGAKTGMVAILHTWGQNLSLHPHIHCLVPSGGLNASGKWKSCRSNGKFLVHVKKLSKVFRGKFTDGLIDLDKNGKINLPVKFGPKKKYLHPYYDKKWVVYSKKPLPTSNKVVEYMGRYSHRIAISNHRIKEVKDGRVYFSWFDYRSSKTGVMNLDAVDFLHRFLLHVLPEGFMKIRHYGILASKNKAQALQTARNDLKATSPLVDCKKLTWVELFEMLYGRHPKLCPCCKQGIMVAREAILPNKVRGPPVSEYEELMAFRP